MKIKLIDIIVFLSGASVFVLGYWISGNDIPTERGAKMLFVIVESIAFGGIATSLHQLIKK